MLLSCIYSRIHPQRLSHEVKCLKEHDPEIEQLHRAVIEKLKAPLSEANVEELNNFVLNHKEKAKNAELDLKDAKRRVAAAKAAKKPRKGQAEQELSDDESDVNSA